MISFFLPLRCVLYTRFLLPTGLGQSWAQSFRFPKQQVVTRPGKHDAFLEEPIQFGQVMVSFVQKLPR
ncbi:hypothetical protein HMJ29_00650 [Hymenobacter taeanensis]|uniref:Alpha/beta hydrolase n=1 Tax=Hymenobacter taeanensis TaxID=2735321 RepID=A0A6M6BEC5_9BACT|nr:MULTISPECIES: hypothetical protein [Hymenobacter]QJX45525.1 hypothetical protein HMJ29_00650 [Hymenobacter taeanensis]UOQ81227.1 hypothetical protein MUN83_00030 [Hymenobacter sp. 5414T-23]